MNVLHIDDDTVVHKLISCLFKRYEQLHEKAVHYTAFVDPVQGLFEILNCGHKYDLVLLDVHLPNLNGGDIYQQIAHSQPQLLKRVMFITSYKDDLARRFPNQRLKVLEKPLRYAPLEAVMLEAAG